MSQPGIVLFGNCQAGAFADAFRRLPCLAGYAILFVSSFDMEQGKPARQLDLIDTTGVVLVIDQLEVDTPTPAWLTERLPSGTATLSYVPMDTNLLWPFHFDDPRNKPEPAFGFGRYPYGDRIVVELMKRGLRGEAAYNAYRLESLRRLPRLDRLAALDTARIEARETHAQVKVADIIADQFREQQLFWTRNHPSGWLFRQVAARMLDLLRPLLGLSCQPAELDAALQDFDPLQHQQIPIHPAVARQLRLAWWRPGQTYRAPDGAMLTFEAYMRRYIDFA